MTEQQQQAERRHDEVTAGATTLASPDVDVTDARQNSLSSDAWGQLRRNPLFWVGVVLGVFFLLMAAFPRCSLRRDPRPRPDRQPGRAVRRRWFGYDVQGRDVYARTGSTAPGLAWWALLSAGHPAHRRGDRRDRRLRGGWVDALLSRIADIFFGLPFVLGAIVILTTFNGVGQRRVRCSW